MFLALSSVTTLKKTLFANYGDSCQCQSAFGLCQNVACLSHFHNPRASQKRRFHVVTNLFPVLMLTPHLSQSGQIFHCRVHVE